MFTVLCSGLFLMLILFGPLWLDRDNPYTPEDLEWLDQMDQIDRDFEAGMYDEDA